VSVGLIQGDYDFEDGRPSFRHFRRTVWLRHRISRDALSAAARRRIIRGSERTVDVEPVIRPMDFLEWARGAAVVAIQGSFPPVG
jgi:hypothetical protein